MFLRGLQVGLVGGVGFGLFAAWLADGRVDPGLLGGGLLAGLAFGLMTGLGLMLVLLVVRGVDRLAGWRLGARLEASQPGLAGALVGLLSTPPGMVVGSLGLGMAAWKALQDGWLGLPPA